MQVNYPLRLLEVEDLPEWRKAVTATIVAVNGCFDLLHEGHKHFLKVAKTYGDVLIVGLNSDDSVKALKGEGRPIQNEHDRAKNLLELPEVDFVCIFRWKRATQFLALSSPTVWCKSDEYRGCIDPNELQMANCSIVFIPRLPGLSTTEMLRLSNDKRE